MRCCEMDEWMDGAMDIYIYIYNGGVVALGDEFPSALILMVVAPQVTAPNSWIPEPSPPSLPQSHPSQMKRMTG